MLKADSSVVGPLNSADSGLGSRAYGLGCWGAEGMYQETRRLQASNESPRTQRYVGTSWSPSQD